MTPFIPIVNSSCVMEDSISISFLFFFCKINLRMCVQTFLFIISLSLRWNNGYVTLRVESKLNRMANFLSLETTIDALLKVIIAFFCSTISFSNDKLIENMTKTLKSTQTQTHTHHIQTNTLELCRRCDDCTKSTERQNPTGAILRCRLLVSDLDQPHMPLDSAENIRFACGRRGKWEKMVSKCAGLTKHIPISVHVHPPSTIHPPHPPLNQRLLRLSGTLALKMRDESFASKCSYL